MRGWLVVNGFLKNGKFNEIHKWLFLAAQKQGIDMQMFTNADLMVSLGQEWEQAGMRPDFVLFWDKDIRLAKFLEQRGYPVFNSSEAIRLCDDKSLTHLILQNEGIPMPETILAPMTFPNIGYTNLDFLKQVEEKLGFPMIVKECFGSFGQQVYKVDQKEQLIYLVKEKEKTPLIFQKFISASSGRDVRIQVIGNEVAASMYRYSEDGDFRANITAGGKMKPYKPSAKQTELALKCCKILGLDFAGVDMLFGADGDPVVCEVNSNAHFKNIYDCTGINAAERMLSYIVNKVRDEEKQKDEKNRVADLQKKRHKKE